MERKTKENTEKLLRLLEKPDKLDIVSRTVDLTISKKNFVRNIP